MKKTKIISLVLFIGVIFLLSGCASIGGINEEMIIAPDPDNPFQGTWVAIGSPNYIHVIEGMNGAWYYRSFYTGWTKNAVYTIDSNDNGYVTSNHWRINVNNDILTVENMTYERYVKK